MDLVLQLNDQLKEMGKELDSLIQLKKDSLENAPTTIIPTATTVVPSTLAESLAPIPLMATTLPASTSATGSTTSAQPGDEASRLVKAMKDMSIQTTEMNKLKEKVTSLETNYKLAQIMHKEEVQKETRMNERIISL